MRHASHAANLREACLRNGAEPTRADAPQRDDPASHHVRQASPKGPPWSDSEPSSDDADPLQQNSER